MIFECEFEAVRGIFFAKNWRQRIFPGILLWILSILTYSGSQTNNRSKSYAHSKFTGHLCISIFLFVICLRFVFCLVICVLFFRSCSCSCSCFFHILCQFFFCLNSVSNSVTDSVWEQFGLLEEFRGLGFCRLLNLFAY